MRVLWRYMKPWRLRMAGGLSLKMSGALLELALPAILAHILDVSAPADDGRSVTIWGLAMAGVAFLAWAMNVAANRRASKVAAGVTGRLRADLFRRVMGLSAEQLDRLTASSLEARLTTDTYNIHSFLAMVQRVGVRAPMLLTGGVLFCLVLDWRLGLVLVGLLPVVGILSNLLARRSVRAFGVAQTKVDDLVRRIRAVVRGLITIRAMDQGDAEASKFAVVNGAAATGEARAASVMALGGPMVRLALYVGMAAALVLAGWLVVHGGLRRGVVVAFLSYFFQVTNALLTFNRIFAGYSRASASAERVAAVLELPLEKTVGYVPAHDGALVTFDAVGFSYADGRTALENLSFSVGSGETLGVVGASGSGKSTLVDLLVGRLAPATGTIGRAVDLTVGIAFQNDFLFAGTAADNVDFGRGLPRDEIWQALEDAQAVDFLVGRGGADFAVASRAANLSGGQRQRLVLARALASRPDLLVLDDATSALDFATEGRFRRVLADRYGGTAKVLVAQRIASVRKATRILVLDQGRMVGLGTHDELMAGCPVYRRLAGDQLEEPRRTIDESVSAEQTVDQAAGTTEAASKPDVRVARRALVGLTAYLLPRRVELLMALVLVLIGDGATLLAPRLAGEAIGAMDSSGALPLVRRWASMALGIWTLASVAAALSGWLMVRLSQSVVRDVRRDLFGHIVALTLPALERRTAGDLVSRLTYDVDLMSRTLAEDAITVLSSLVAVVGTFVMMLLISPRLASFLLVTLPITVVFTIWRVRRTRPLFALRSRGLGELNGFVEEMVSGQRTIRCYGQEAWFMARFVERNDETTDCWYEADWAGSFNGPSVTLVTNLSLALVGTVGGLMFMNGAFGLGALSAFVLYSRRFSGPVNQIATLVADFQAALAAAIRCRGFLDQPVEPPDETNAIEPRAVRGDLSFRNVSFGYEQERGDVLRELSMEIPAGSTAALVGASGAGKTTLTGLLLRLYEPSSGAIELDGLPLTRYRRGALRRCFGLVLQEPWLFAGSFRENIAYARPEASDDEVRRAARAAGIDELIENRSGGYAGLIAEGGANLSQGERQLVAIARALLADAPLLVLDEATSGVDGATERQLQVALARLVAGRTVLTIAHRLSTVRAAQCIWVLDGGRVVERGTHDELLRAGGAYARFYAAQFA